ncbi:hypothetical protein DsansV1_C04g0037521 [Dioscorea sansibarensis]
MVLMPVSGILVSMNVSHVAIIRHDFAIPTELLLKHSSKALNIAPLSWLHKTKAKRFSHAVIAFSSSSCEDISK